MKGQWLVGLVFGAVLVGHVSAGEGDDIVAKHCKACHEAGLAGAPKLGDKAAWAPRIATGIDAMSATVLSGKGAMPPKGTCGTCTPEQIKAAVESITAGM